MAIHFHTSPSLNSSYVAGVALE